MDVYASLGERLSVRAAVRVWCRVFVRGQGALRRTGHLRGRFTASTVQPPNFILLIRSERRLLAIA